MLNYVATSFFLKKRGGMVVEYFCYIFSESCFFWMQMKKIFVWHNLPQVSQLSLTVAEATQLFVCLLKEFLTHPNTKCLQVMNSKQQIPVKYPN